MAGVQESQTRRETLMTSFVQDTLRGSDELEEVTTIAARLHEHLNTAIALDAMATVSQPGASSSMVQGTFAAFAAELGFTSEAKGLFASYPTSAVRPDYFRRLPHSGILMEVERGKTTINNMDFLDFWKCHICQHAHYLFLMVPTALRQNDSMTPRNEYNAVVKRLGAFFTPENYTNVRGLWIFGY